MARAALPLLVLSFGLLLLVGVAGESAAKPGLGPRGWAPGELPWAPGAALVTALLWAAYGFGAVGVFLRLRMASPGAAVRWRWPLVLGLFALCTSPFGSADHTNYAAYGRIADLGGDPYLTSPAAWSATDAVTSLVEPPWTRTVSVYGPFATMLQALTSHLGGGTMRQTVWLWQVLTVVAWWAVRALLVRSAREPTRVDTLWTLNPLVFGVGVLGAHLDLVVAALALAALLVAARSPVATGLLTGLALSCKVTYGLVAVAVVVAWWLTARQRIVQHTAQLALGAAVVAVPLHLWAGPHVFDQLGRARRQVSLATPWRLVLELLTGPLSNGTARTVVAVLSVLLLVVLAAVLAVLTRGVAPATTTAQAVRWAFVLTTAYALSAPYSLPWYLLLTWATLPLLAGSVLDGALLAHFTALALAYVPGRVNGMTPGVERTTLWVRRSAVPYAVLVVWGWLTLAAGRGLRRSSAPRPPAP